MKKLVASLSVFVFVACGEEVVDKRNKSEDIASVNLSLASSSSVIRYTDKSKAIANSPSGEVCEFGSIDTREVFVPANRGRGNNNGEWKTITEDNRWWEVAYIRMDVNYDGQLDIKDQKLATRNIYVKQIENEECPAVADIGTFGQGFGPDEFFTSEGIFQWKEARKRGVQATHDLLSDENKLVCASRCSIINHMAP